MAIRITCIKKSNGHHENPHIAISELGWIEDGTNQTGRTSRIDMYNWINSGGHAYVRDSRGNVAYLMTAVSPSGTQYVKTKPDGTTSDNLLTLPECK